MKDIVISKLSKPGESVAPHIHLFPWNYTHNLTCSHEIIPLFSPQDTMKLQSRTHPKRHEPTGAHECTCRSACENADVQAHKHMQERTHICAGLQVRSGSTHARAGKHRCTQARVGPHACTRTHTPMHIHARRCTHARTLVRSHRRSHTRASTHRLTHAGMLA